MLWLENICSSPPHLNDITQQLHVNYSFLLFRGLCIKGSWGGWNWWEILQHYVGEDYLPDSTNTNTIHSHYWAWVGALGCTLPLLGRSVIVLNASFSPWNVELQIVELQMVSQTFPTWCIIVDRYFWLSLLALYEQTPERSRLQKHLLL